MTRVKGQLTTAEYLPIAEFNRLCERLHDDNEFFWELYARLSYCTALRVSDVLSLTWKQVLGQEQLVKIEQKTGKTRPIPFNESVRTRLQILYSLLGSPDIDSLIFANPKTKLPYSKEHINRTLKKFMVKYQLGIKHFSTHTFRKTFGREVYESRGRTDESLILLNQIFQHANIRTTQVYLGITNDEVNQVYDHIQF